MLSDAYDQLNTTNLALNKLAEVLAYDVRSILLYTHQVKYHRELTINSQVCINSPQRADYPASLSNVAYLWRSGNQ